MSLESQFVTPAPCLNSHPKLLLFRMKGYLLIFTLMLSSFVSLTAGVANVQQTVDRLITTVEKSNCTFIRNGSEHSPKEAAEHMRKKYNYFKKQIQSPADFIEKCASKSELSGKAYMVKFPGGKTEKCADWLREKLKENS